MFLLFDCHLSSTVSLMLSLCYAYILYGPVYTIQYETETQPHGGNKAELFHIVTKILGTQKKVF